MIFTMTDEIAYKLGKFDFPHFYQFAQWRVNKEPFELAYFFNWSVPGGMGGWPCKNDGSGETDWENITAGGSLKLDLIKEVSHKLNYIRGRLSSYSVIIKDNEIIVYYANSHSFRDFFAECLDEVIKDKFFLLPQREGEFGRQFCNFDKYKYNIIKEERLATIPACPSVTLKADKEIINYIVGKNVN